jgi:hypothetical protein
LMGWMTGPYSRHGQSGRHHRWVRSSEGIFEGLWHVRCGG